MLFRTGAALKQRKPGSAMESAKLAPSPEVVVVEAGLGDDASDVDATEEVLSATQSGHEAKN